jgi:putative ABC transport system ATP-binding protein
METSLANKNQVLVQPIVESLDRTQSESQAYNVAGGSFTALKDVDMQADAGEFVAVVGKSGSGKSTLINMITGIDTPTSGEVFVASTPVHELDQEQLAVWRGRNVGVVFQFFQLLPTLTVPEYYLPMILQYVSVNERRDVRSLLEKLVLRNRQINFPQTSRRTTTTCSDCARAGE